MIPNNNTLNLNNSAFSLFSLAANSSQQQQQLLFLQAQQILQKTQQQQQQQQSIQNSNNPQISNSPSSFPNPSAIVRSQPSQPLSQLPSVSQLQPSLSVLPSETMEQFNQNLFYQAVFAGKELEMHLDSTLKRKNKLEDLPEYLSRYSFPTFIQLIGNIVLASLQGTFEEGDVRVINELIENPLKIQLKESVWKLACQVISRKFFSFQDLKFDAYAKELSQLLFFRQEITDIIFILLADSQGILTLGSLLSLHQMLQSSEKQLEIFGSLAFQQFGGRLFTIRQDSFKSLFEANINILAGYFEKPNTIVSFVRRSNKLNYAEDQLLQKYLRLMGDFKQTNLKNFLQRLCSSLFDNAESIEKNVFLKRIPLVHDSTNSQIIFTLLLILGIELDLVHRQEFTKFFKETATKPASNVNNDSSNYYLKTMDKLLNKCVFNGDDKCECKKCQCIRRNRNSAKESQKKKRDALQQIGPLLEKQEILEKRLQELESENTILRKLLTEISQKGDNYSTVQEIFQPISKIISYQLKEEDEPNSELSAIDSGPSKKLCHNQRDISSFSSSVSHLQKSEAISPFQAILNQEINDNLSNKPNFEQQMENIPQQQTQDL